MSLEIPIYIVDAFTDKPFQGNPAAICLLNSEQEITDEMKQSIALEMNLSETAFVYKLNPNDSFETSSTFGLRWFTPATEVDLCGHATVATSKTLFEICANKSAKLTFESRWSGSVFSSCLKDGTIVLDFPNHKPKKVEQDKIADFAKLASCGFPVIDVQFSSRTKKLLIRLADHVTRSEFESLVPPTNELHKMVSDGSIMGTILTVKGSKENNCLDENEQVYDFISRYFAPWVGIHEDPVCGSAHSVLTPYWAEQLNKTELYARQCSKRGGELRLKVRDSERVNIGGKSRVVLKGTIIV